MTAKVCTVDFNVTVKNFARVDLLRDSLTQFVGKNERCFILAIDVAGQLNHAHALGGVHNQADRGQQIHKIHLARCKDRAGCNAKLVRTRLTLELAARGDLVRLIVVALWANSFTVSLRPAHFAEQTIRRVFASFVDAAKAKCAGCR
jgi:hypothetical protein